MGNLDQLADECAVVIDEHTGRLRAKFQGIGATADANAFLRQCRAPKNPKERVDHLSSAVVITGEKAKKAIKNGRL